VHRVGVSASAVGIGSLLALGFADVSPNRVVTGTVLSITEALSASQAAVVFALWGLAALMSLVGWRRRTGAFVRGASAALAVVAIFWVSGVAATAAVAQYGEFTRYSLGGGVWLSLFAAFTLIVAARRELGLTSTASWVVTVLAPLGILALALTGGLRNLGLAAEYRNVADDFWIWVGQQITYASAAIVIATTLGVVLGVLAFRRSRYAHAIFATTSVFQTIPGLAMVGILVVPLGALAARYPVLREFGIGGLGWAPVVVALTLYALLAIVRNTYAGLGSVPQATVEAGAGMGMSGRQVMTKVQLPLAAPILFSGVRTASQQTIGNATLGAFVAAGTLGAPIFLGFAQQADDLVILGSVALVVLALLVDGVLRGVQKTLTPTHKRKERGR